MSRPHTLADTPPLRAVKIPSPPAGLSAEARKLWSDVLEEFELPAHAAKTLHVACQTLDRLREAQAAIAADGIILDGRQGPRPHPGIAIERDSRTAFLRAMREIGLDIAEPATLRPPTRFR